MSELVEILRAELNELRERVAKLEARGTTYGPPIAPYVPPQQWSGPWVSPVLPVGTADRITC